MRRNFFSLRTLAATLSVAALTGLSACGGGGDAQVGFQVGVFVDGQASGDYVYAGDIQQVVMAAGSSIELDASEPVVWTLQVGNTVYEGFDTSVFYQGVTITATTLNSSRIALDTFSDFFLPAPVLVTLTAVSTFDAAIIATVDVLITN